jgi:phosphatidylinositol alpha-mannosyltransferase
VGLVSPYDLSVPGGVQAQVLGLSAYLDDRGHTALVIGPGLPEGVPGVDLGGSISVPGNGSRAPISIDPRVRRRLAEAASGIDLLHVHEPLMPLASLLACHAGPPVVATFHAAPERAVRRVYRLTRPLFRRLMGNTVAVTAVSPTAAAMLPPGVDFEIVPNGLDVEAMQVETKRSEGKVVFLGRDEPRKGLDVLLAAWPAILEAVPGAELTVIGAVRPFQGPVWLERVDEAQKARILGSAAVYVAPHLGGESFGIVLIEAMAAGAAVVASNLDAFVAVAGGAARFFPAGDGAALAEAVVHVLRNPAERDRMGESGVALARRYDWSVIGPAYEDVYARSLP